MLSICAIGILTESCNSSDESCPTINCNTGTLNEETCTCDCPVGFIGANCDIEDLCVTQSVVCQNGGVCVDGTCDCPTGFSGTNCEIEDLCVTQNVVCQNGGICLDGICDCPPPYIGANCEQIDPTQIQALLDGGTTPKALYDGGVSLEQLYGKIYAGGFIFYLNTNDGSGMVAATENQSDAAQWGCSSTDISGLNNVQNGPTEPETETGARIGDGESNTIRILTGCVEPSIAAKLCRDFGTGWYLPSRGELNLMYTNLHMNGHGGFADGNYHSSTELDGFDVWDQNFNDGTQRAFIKGVRRNVRAAKTF